MKALEPQRRPVSGPAESEPPIDLESIKQVREIFQAMGKVLKAIKIYPESNPLRLRFVQEFVGRLLTFLKVHGDFILRIKRSEMMYEEQVVYSNPVKEENFALKLYGDGVREVHICEGLEEQEVLDFIQVVTGGDADEDDDSITLLWDKEFQNIRYVIVEVGGDDSTSAAVPLTEGMVRQNAVGLHAAQQQTSTAAASKAMPAPSIEVEAETLYGKSLPDIFVLSPDEVAQLQREMGEEERGDAVSDLIEMLFQVLQVTEDIEDYSEMLESLDRSLGTLVLHGDLRRALLVLRTLKEWSLPEKALSIEHAAKANQIVDHMGSEEAIQALGAALNASRLDDPDALYQYVLLLNPAAIPPLTSLLGDLKQMKIRRLLCEALVVLAKEHVVLLTERLPDPQWYVVRNIVYILGKIGDPTTLPSLAVMVKHSEVRVRKEVVTALGEIKHADAANLLLEALADENPQIRVASLKCLVRIGQRSVAVQIEEIIRDPDFGRRELIEKKEYLDALGRLLGNDALPFLRENLLKTSWWGRVPLDELRLCASLALGRIGTPEAIGILMEGASSKDKVTRKISQDVLSDMKVSHG